MLPESAQREREARSQARQSLQSLKSAAAVGVDEEPPAPAASAAPASGEQVAALEEEVQKYKARCAKLSAKLTQARDPAAPEPRPALTPPRTPAQNQQTIKEQKLALSKFKSMAELDDAPATEPAVYAHAAPCPTLAVRCLTGARTCAPGSPAEKENAPTTARRGLRQKA